MGTMVATCGPLGLWWKQTAATAIASLMVGQAKIKVAVPRARARTREESGTNRMLDGRLCKESPPVAEVARLLKNEILEGRNVAGAVARTTEMLVITNFAGRISILKGSC